MIDEIKVILDENQNITEEVKEDLLELINNWPNKYSNDDKTMLVIK